MHSLYFSNTYLPNFTLSLTPMWYGARYLKYLSSPFDKSQPYMSITKRFRITNDNMSIHFSPSLGNEGVKLIACRHFACQFIKDCWNDVKRMGKVEWMNYDSMQAIQRHIPFGLEEEYEIVVNNAKRYDLIRNDRLGQHIKMCFEDMQRPEKKETLRTLLIESTTHAMALRLCIKGDKDRPVYVVNFYDPNKTNAAMRCESTDLSVFEMHSLELYVNGCMTIKKGDYQCYYDDIGQVSIVMECDLSSFIEPETQLEKQFTHVDLNPLTPTHINFLLSGNFHIEFAQLHSQFKAIAAHSQDELVDLLVAKNKEGIPGFYYVKQGDFAQIKAIFLGYANLVSNEKVRDALLACALGYEEV